MGRKASMALLFVLIFCAPVLGGSVVLFRIDGSDAGLERLKMFVDSKPAGVVGDTLELTPVNHGLDIELPHGLVISYALMVKKDVVSVSVAPSRVCAGNTMWDVTSSQSSFSRQAAIPTVKLGRPQVTYAGVCPTELPNLPCTAQMVPLHIDSMPEVVAEIWIDGMPVRAATPKLLNVSFCADQFASIDVQLRKPGYEPCTVTVTLDNEGRSQNAVCSLGRPTRLTQEQASIDFKSVRAP